jgi:hypothetical protein
VIKIIKVNENSQRTPLSGDITSLDKWLGGSDGFFTPLPFVVLFDYDTTLRQHWLGLVGGQLLLFQFVFFARHLDHVVEGATV